MTAETTDAQWVVAYNSVIGNGHIQMNLPCQDSCHHEKVNTTWGIAVVADGAGSAKYSDVGSDFVVRNTAHCLKEVLERKVWATKEQLPSDKEWREEALKALQLVMQRLVLFAKENGYQPADLACTVIATIYSPFGLLVAHIGDGRAAYSDGEGWKALIEPFRGDEANETVFITSGIWTKDGVEKYIRTKVHTMDVHGFALMTDGCEKGSFEVNLYNEEEQKYYDPNRPFAKFFEPNAKGLLMLHKEEKTQSEINDLWGSFLTGGNRQFKHEIDDKTMILAVRVPSPEDKNTAGADTQTTADTSDTNNTSGS